MKKLLLLFLLLPVVAFAQQTTINGSDHPELIPDDAAAVAVFSVHSMFSTPGDIVNTAKQQAKLRFSPTDLAVYQAAMQAFASHSEVRAATYTNLLPTLSPDGQAKLKAFIQAEKARMQYHMQKPILQGWANENATKPHPAAVAVVDPVYCSGLQPLL